ncbi:DNA repair protein RecN [Acaryochloris thomasi RCC1774]|uniref:DNA repair protein RecN n=1 Tax=Acaryochloris thomasi RCC1774 TaxID=1764569 RepID=A0A2W1JLE6_9CYAN|nr:DNA repair protein RecN [Acaryochloris thomasi]PZD71732.1 DNA repair protein RecN [Acaryochloris thomasi RCC1774]
MLLSLQIENFALIDSLTLEFGAGLNVLTGETGAGKSIILDAIDIILGGKISDRILRTGSHRALLEASFQLSPILKDWLTAAEIDELDDGVLICSREISNQQEKLRSRSRVNGVVINKQQMAGLREHLVDITAQGQTVHLGRANRQRDWLDHFGGAKVLDLRRTVALAFAQFQQAQQALEQYRANDQQRLQQIDLLKYQLEDLEQAQLTEADEQDNLIQESQRLGHSVELQLQSQQVYEALYEQEQGAACSDLLGKAEATLTEMGTYDAQIQPILELVQEALTQVQEAGLQINAYGADLETDPQRLQDVEDRLTQLKQICRKYGPTLADAIAHHQRISAELAVLGGDEQSLEGLEQRYQVSQKELTEACVQLTQLRQAAAQTLADRLLLELKPLAMDKVQFQVALQPTAPAAHGSDLIQFLFSPNPGEPLQPVSETASGGEMSRFLLALKACFSQIEDVDTLVFDEIDVGVSGQVAQSIATKLHALGKHHQVLCVTHQPIVAAMADQHFQVAKQVLDAEQAHERTVVRVTALEAPERRQALAEIAGGQSAEGALPFVDTLLQEATALRQGKKKRGKKALDKTTSRQKSVRS